MINFIYELPVALQLLLALLVPFVGSMLIGPRLIAILRAMKAGQPIRQACGGTLAPEHQEIGRASWRERVSPRV